MTFKAEYKKREELYQHFFSTIKDIHFTLREADMLACILHNRGEKKIASILSLAPRTVGVHVYNIMRKIRCNSKDQIIDFMENSGKLLHMSEYYLHLRVIHNFEKALNKIKNLVNKEITNYYCSRQDILAISNSDFQVIQKHCLVANILLSEIPRMQNDSSNDEPNSNNLDSSSNINFDLKKIDQNDYYYSLLTYICQLLRLSQDSKDTDKNKKNYANDDGNNEINGFNSSQSKSDNIVQIITEIEAQFNAAYQLIKDTYEGKAKLDDSLNTNSTIYSRLLTSINSNKLLSTLIISLMLTTIFGTAYRTIYASNNSNSNLVRNKVKAQIINDLEQLLIDLKDKNFSVDNSNKRQARTNNSLIKQVEKILDYNNTKEVIKYFNKAAMPAEYLTNYLYNLNAIACYYMYNKHDGIKSFQILSHAKNIAENYVNTRSGVPCNFDIVTPAEVLAEFQIIKGLAEVYTGIVYSLGRTYIYTGNYSKGKKYFTLAKYLGGELNLLEGYLSDKSGLLVIKKMEAEEDIANNRKEIAKIKLEQIIQAYKLLTNDARIYVQDFKPGSTEAKIMIPKDELYNQFDTINKIIDSYVNLIAITAGKKKSDYIKEVEDFLGKYNSTTISAKAEITDTVKDLFSKLKDLPSRKIAQLHNNLANLLFVLGKTEIGEDYRWNIESYSKIEKTVKSLLKFKLATDRSSDSKNDSSNSIVSKRENTGKNSDKQVLNFIEYLFKKSISYSRNTDFTKADAYMGLIAVYDTKLRQGTKNGQHKQKNTLTEKERQELTKKIDQLTKKRDSINKSLNRKVNVQTNHKYYGVLREQRKGNQPITVVD